MKLLAALSSIFKALRGTPPPRPGICRDCGKATTDGYCEACPPPTAW